MKSLPLGSSGIQVSAFCLGTMYFGSRTSTKDSFRLLDAYFDRGGRFLDTANIYAWWVRGGRGGESEELLGKWLRSRGCRERMIIASKVGFEMPGVERGLSAENIERECHASLRRLGLRILDLYYAHVDDRMTPMEETLEAFHRLQRAGAVRVIGASNFTAWRLERARRLSLSRGIPAYCCVQQRYTYLRPHAGARFDPQLAADSELLDYTSSERMTLLAYTPLLEGSYTRSDKPLSAKYAGPDSKARLRALRSVARDLGATPNQVVLAWMLAHSPPVLPVFGVSTIGQLEENLGALDLELTPEMLQRLDRASA